MKYNKPTLTISDQISALKDKGLMIDNEVYAANCLSNISYYRLRAYTYPFQDNPNPDHPFIVVLDIYLPNWKQRRTELNKLRVSQSDWEWILYVSYLVLKLLTFLNKQYSCFVQI